MEMNEQLHPSTSFEEQFNSLIGIDQQKDDLLTHLQMILDQKYLSNWLNQHHKDGLWGTAMIRTTAPLVVLHGEVGCGKSALGNSVGSPLAKNLEEKKLITIQSPNNIRGSGLVGEIANRITAVVDRAIQISKERNLPVILIFDEADDIATSRSQMQAHHEDRAGLNALIKQIDKIVASKTKLVVILITNRVDVLDPAIRRRASAEIGFNRPDKKSLIILFKTILTGLEFSKEQLHKLVTNCLQQEIPFSYSDIVNRIYKACLLKAIKENRSLSIEDFIAEATKIQPTPLLERSIL
jgi:AAA+ superfamily predicted ATPase